MLGVVSSSRRARFAAGVASAVWSGAVRMRGQRFCVFDPDGDPAPRDKYWKTGFSFDENIAERFSDLSSSSADVCIGDGRSGRVVNNLKTYDLEAFPTSLKTRNNAKEMCSARESSNLFCVVIFFCFFFPPLARSPPPPF